MEKVQKVPGLCHENREPFLSQLCFELVSMQKLRQLKDIETYSVVDLML